MTASPATAIVSRQDEIEERAEQVLGLLKRRRIPTDPLALAEAAGIDVRVSTFKPSKRDVIVMLVIFKGVTSIHVRESVSLQMKRQAIAHAFGHYFLHFEKMSEIT